MIDERPGGPGPAPAAPPAAGVSHREISWRAAVLRRSLPVLTPPRWLDPVVLVLLVGYLFGGIGAVPFALEEGVQTALTADVPALATRPASVLPGAEVPAALDAARLAYGSLTRYAAAPGWYAAGGRADRAPVDPAAAEAAVRMPDRSLLLAARAGPALLAAVGLLVVFLLARRLLGRPAALVAVALVGLHPAFALTARQVADAGPTLAFGLATVLVAVGIATAVADGGEPRLGAWTALAALAGLALAAGADAVPYLAGALAFVLVGVAAGQVRRRRALLSGGPAGDPGASPGAGGAGVGPGAAGFVRVGTGERATGAARAGGSAPGRAGAAPSGPAAGPGGPLGWLAVSALGAVLVWVAVSPALWGWLPDRLEARHADRPALIARGLLPDPGPTDGAARLQAAVGVVADPFLTPSRRVQAVEPNGYERSWWAGLPLGERGAGANGPLTTVLPPVVTGVVSTLLGILLTTAAALGLVGLWRISRTRAAAVTGWLAATAVWAVLTPSNQAGHLLPLLAVAALLAGAALAWGLSFVAHLSRDVKEAEDARLSPDSLDFLGTRDPGAHRVRR